MKSRLIFDTGPIFLYFAEDKQVKEMFDEVIAGRAEGYTCETNIAEFYYKTCEKLGREVAEVRHTSIRHSKMSILAVDERLTRVAGGLKCIHRSKISLADAYIVAAAKMLGGTLVTTDPQLAELKLVQTRLLSIP
ncbi:MAG: type II toxin-antitoxin system VapC family toxin [Candidatus Verstraetearchaeota archaeon]|jgi:predicted nucleic acid-binding protein|nr:type II toxin-antitoxin system VapC family toxin [Candidatus Methanomethylicia archaeon]NHV60363.1 type II toxin-antitoxin system VapC family toxin [Candidatus Verstraetearchaeota archaeon]